MKSKNDYTKEFLNYVGILNAKGITDTAISNQTEIKRHRISNMKRNKSYADKMMVQILLIHYKELNKVQADDT